MANKVFVYDDDGDILEICRYILEAMGLEVFTKKTCSSVVDDLKISRPDVVIMDNWIPDIGGVEATKLIKGDPELRHIRVILFTASRDIRNIASEAKADDYIEKPFDLKRMEAVVRKALKTSSDDGQPNAK